MRVNDEELDNINQLLVSLYVKHRHRVGASLGRFSNDSESSRGILRARFPGIANHVVQTYGEKTVCGVQISAHALEVNVARRLVGSYMNRSVYPYRLVLVDGGGRVVLTDAKPSFHNIVRGCLILSLGRLVKRGRVGKKGAYYNNQ